MFSPESCSALEAIITLQVVRTGGGAVYCTPNVAADEYAGGYVLMVMDRRLGQHMQLQLGEDIAGLDQY